MAWIIKSERFPLENQSKTKQKIEIAHFYACNFAGTISAFPLFAHSL